MIINNKLQEKCGVFAIDDFSGELDVARLAYYALLALQHRGQEACGIAVKDSGTVIAHKDIGLVNDVFNDVVLRYLNGHSALGHVLYIADKKARRDNVEPFVIRYRNGQLAISMNGCLVNGEELRNSLEEEGVIFQSSSDSELILSLISRNSIGSDSFVDALLKTLVTIKGAYAFAIMSEKGICGVRDPLGIKPLCIGKLQNSYVLASESVAFDTIGAEFIRDVEPGEIVFLEQDGIKSIRYSSKNESKLCIFEHVYYARPDSIMDGASVYLARVNMGRQLAKESPVEADIVCGVPDSGISSAIGYSIESGITYCTAIVKNRYIGRTFIKPEQNAREINVRIKLNVLKEAVKDKRIVLIDDSIVRGTTTKNLIRLMKEAGAREVHIRIASPPFIYPCKYGLDTPSKESLVASRLTIEEIRKNIVADSLEFISLEGLLNTPEGSRGGFCSACFTGKYPVL